MAALRAVQRRRRSALAARLGPAGSTAVACRITPQFQLPDRVVASGCWLLTLYPSAPGAPPLPGPFAVRAERDEVPAGPRDQMPDAVVTERQGHRCSVLAAAGRAGVRA